MTGCSRKWRAARLQRDCRCVGFRSGVLGVMCHVICCCRDAQAQEAPICKLWLFRQRAHYDFVHFQLVLLWPMMFWHQHQSVDHECNYLVFSTTCHWCQTSGLLYNSVALDETDGCCCLYVHKCAHHHSHNDVQRQSTIKNHFILYASAIASVIRTTIVLNTIKRDTVDAIGMPHCSIAPM